MAAATRVPARLSNETLVTTPIRLRRNDQARAIKYQAKIRRLVRRVKRVNRRRPPRWYFDSIEISDDEEDDEVIIGGGNPDEEPLSSA
jgi:hypothetical protein